MPTTLPRSSIANITWPPIPSPAAGSLLSTLFAWEQAERWSRTDIEQQQFKQLALLLKWARQHVPFYADILKGIDVENINADILRTLPVLSKTHIQQNHDELKAGRTPEGHGGLETKATSGSTGTPIKVDWTDLTTFLWHVAVQRDHQWHQRDFTNTLASIRHVRFDIDGETAKPPHGMQLPNWGPTVAECFDTGAAQVLSIHSSAEEQATWLEKTNAGYLQTYPSNLQKLCNFYRSEARIAPQFRAIRTISEVLDPQTRLDAMAVFNAPVQDVYSTTEVGYIAIQCPKHEHLHVQSETLYVEVIDEQGQPCAPGDIGRVLVTPLHNFAMPLIRYDIGDYAEVGEQCDCGRNSLVLNRVHGRSRNLLTFPDGRTDWPVFQDSKFRDIAPISQFQFKQTSEHDIELSLVTERDFTAAECRELSAFVIDSLGYPFHLEFNFVDTIDRSVGGKYEDFISLIR